MRRAHGASRKPFLVWRADSSLASPGLQSGEVIRNRLFCSFFLRGLKSPARCLQESALVSRIGAEAPRARRTAQAASRFPPGAKAPPSPHASKPPTPSSRRLAELPIRDYR